jgi:pyruvate dehydrogenase (quinone)/pyruvate oxidase
MSSSNIAHQLLNFLQKNGIETIYGVTGDVLFPFFDALSQKPEIKFIGTSQEVNAAFMASYQAKLTGKIAVCVATSGPGTANLINGLADAYFDKAPVLAITGQVASPKIGTGAKQEINQQKLLQEVTYSSQQATSSDAVLPVVARALEMAIVNKTVAHVSIPMDLFTQTSEININMPAIAPGSTFTSWDNGFTGLLEEAMPILQNARNPLIVVGIGNKKLREQIEKLAESLGAGIIVTQQAKGIIPHDHPRVLGGIGEAYIPEILKEVDCILQIGTASFEKKYLPTGINTIQIADDTGAIDYKQTNLAVMGNIMDILKSVIAKVEPIENKSWQEKITQEKDKLRSMIGEQRQNKNSPIHPAHLMTVLSELVPADAVIVCDIGGYVHWFDSYFQAKDQTILISSHWRSMGSALPGALGASVSQPEKKVIALVGDGGLMMSLGELATAVKYKIPVTIIVANNHLYELEKIRMEHQGLIPFGVYIHVPDFAALAKSFGAEGKTITNPGELEPLITESLTAPGPVVLDVQLVQVPLPFIN